MTPQKQNKLFRGLLLSLVACLVFPVSLPAADAVILELKDGSILRGQCEHVDAEGPVQIKTEFGELTVPREKIKTVFTPAAGTSVPEEPVETPATASEATEPETIPEPEPAAATGRIRSEEPPMPDKKPEDLLKMDDDDLLSLLEKADIPPVRKQPANPPAGSEAVDVLYGLEDEGPGKLPEGLEEVSIPAVDAPPSELKAVDQEIDSMLSATTAEVSAGDGSPAVEPPAADASTDPAGEATVEVFVPEKGTIDRKIYKQIEKHGGLPVKEEQFRKLKRDEIDKLLQKHKPAEPEAE